MRKTIQTTFALMLTAGLAVAFARAAEPVAKTESKAAPNTLTDQEKKDGWQLLFDGKTTTGWRRLGFDSVPEGPWIVKDGALVHQSGKGGGNDIIYDKQFENFELAWEWIVPKKNGNSGIKYRVLETKGKNGAFGPEYQMMNDPGVTDKHSTASLYDMLPPVNARLAPEGQWNQSRVVIRGNKGEHWLNGQKTVEFEFWNEPFNEALAKSKFKGKEWGKQAKGYIALTDHGDEAMFRSIKIRELPAK
ncbi:3-keto-disaccharide hydrolase [Humisphaera borealis]|uniref:DUF1080 domain-containing protein n=1 Tax=Humisphaera borealis TaxID=2807512 RepID=A0A7M2WX21_9BACT|nr:DUF1080 domain-containing protein [Humisphaera borealis]QOV90045.1 DUF1080 domain-containing protein [Humisphaera borealis]